MQSGQWSIDQKLAPVEMCFWMDLLKALNSCMMDRRNMRGEIGMKLEPENFLSAETAAVTVFKKIGEKKAQKRFGNKRYLPIFAAR